ncbi:MAG: hypothetical protein IJN93_05950 [Clostridia bacterium]|nr:hypothetical protein [Clostridia bacterium]
MKKFLCLFLAVVLLASLCGCFGGNGTDDVRGDIASGSPSQNENENEPEFSLGKATNNTYNNDFLGISCTLPAEWVFYTDEQILELNNIVGTIVDEDIAERLKNANIIYDMCATYQTEGSNININLEKLSAVQMINLDIKQTLEAQIDTIKQTYENMGYTDTNVEYQKIKVDGKEFDGLKLTAKIQGIDFYADTFTFRKSNYLATVTICSLQTDKTDTILSYFTVK